MVLKFLTIAVVTLLCAQVHTRGYEALTSESTIITLTTLINLNKHAED